MNAFFRALLSNHLFDLLIKSVLVSKLVLFGQNVIVALLDQICDLLLQTRSFFHLRFERTFALGSRKFGEVLGQISVFDVGQLDDAVFDVGDQVALARDEAAVPRFGFVSELVRFRFFRRVSVKGDFTLVEVALGFLAV